MKTIISPSLLSCDFLNIESEINILNSIKNIWYHLDIMDGHFVPNMTFGHPIIKMIDSISTNKLDAHLMVSNPEFYITSLSDYNLHNLTFHFEALNNNNSKCLDLIRKAKENFESVGISIKPNTDFSLISDELLNEIDLFLVMSVEPGFGGQSFIKDTYKKLNLITKKRSQLSTNFIIQIDGGVTDENAKKIINSGVDNLVAGSFVFNDKLNDYNSQILKLLEV